MAGSSFSAPHRRLPCTARSACLFLLAALFIAAGAFVLPGAARAAALPPAVEQANAGTILGVVNRAGAQVLSAPEGGDVVAALDLGAIVNALGRSADNQWVIVTTNDGATGWMAAADLVIFGLDNLPVMLGEGAEGSAPATAATAAPAAPLPTVTPRPPTSTPTPVPPTPTFTPTPVPPTPTFTPTPVPPTATPAPTSAAATAQPAATRASSSVGTPGRSGASIVAVVGAQGAPLYDAPGGATLRTLPVGTALNADARSADGALLRVRANGGVTGWVDTARVVAFNAAGLPVADGAGAEPEAAAPPAIESVTTPTRAPGAAATAAPVEETAAITGTADVTTTFGAGTPRPTPRDDGRPRAVVQMTGLRLNVRAEPSTDATIIAKALPREEFIVLGRNPAGDWVQIELPASEGGAGWVAADYVTTSVPVADLPLAGEGAAGAQRAAPTPAASGTPAATAVVPSLALPTATPAGRAATRTAPTGLDGMIAFQDGRNNIYAYNLGTGELRWLTNGYDPAISPDGTQVAFTRGDGRNNGIYRINLDGSGEQKVFGEGQLLRSPKWNPAGDRIVYSRMSGSYKCYDIEYIGCKSFQQLLGEFPFLIIPELAEKFLKDVERKEYPNWGLSRVSPNGENFRDIAALDSAVAPDWNEGGIVYESTAGIEITEDTPTGDTRAVIQEDWDHDPDWQPDDGRILFQSKEGDHWEIWSITPDGGGLVALTRPETTLVDKLPSNVAPAWSQDGEHIVYLSSRTNDEEHGPWRLWVMNADGSDKRRLPIDVAVDYSFASEQVADWGSPPQ